MKTRLRIRLSYLFTAISLFIAYHFWFARRHQDQNLFSSNTSACVVKNGGYPATVEYYNPQTKAEHTFQARVEIEDCSIVKVDLTGNPGKTQVSLPVALEDDGEATTEDTDGGIYTLRIN